MIAAPRRGQSQRVWLAGQLAKLPWEHRQRFLCPPKQGKGSRDTRPEGSDHRGGKRGPLTETREPPQASAQPRRWGTRTEAVPTAAAPGCAASCTAGWLWNMTVAGPRPHGLDRLQLTSALLCPGADSSNAISFSHSVSFKEDSLCLLRLVEIV